MWSPPQKGSTMMPTRFRLSTSGAMYLDIRCFPPRKRIFVQSSCNQLGESLG